MPIAASAAVLAAGLLARSGNHVVQIVIGIVVVIALLGYSLWFLASRRRLGPARAVAEPPAARGSGGAAAGDEATLRLSRIWSGLALGGQSEAWDIVLDGRVVGAIANQETVEVSLVPGQHTLRLGRGRHISRQRTFEVATAGRVSYRCHGPRFWPLWVAAMIKSDLWITLTPD